MELLFATKNKGKKNEIQSMLQDKVQLLQLDEIGFQEDIPENEPTILENAIFKSKYVYEKTGKNCFADDSGLEINALHGEPGVLSARYAGDSKNDLENIKKVLWNLKGESNRKARFVTIISLVINGSFYTFEGHVEGEIIEDLRGNQGFGYDPIFMPRGHSRTFAEMSLEEKNAISHRAIAIQRLVGFLESFRTGKQSMNS